VLVGALVADVPMLIVTALSAVAGAVGVVGGLMLVTGAMDSADFTDGGFVATVQDDWWWYAGFLVVAVGSFGMQLLSAARMRRTLRATWDSRRCDRKRHIGIASFGHHQCDEALRRLLDKRAAHGFRAELIDNGLERLVPTDLERLVLGAHAIWVHRPAYCSRRPS
jgi:hypothetical protein